MNYWAFRNNTVKAYFSAILCISLVGCSTTLDITYYSDPPGASIYDAGVYKGATPFVGHYAIDDADKRNGYVRIRPVTARWISGASTTLETTNVNIKSGTTKSYTFYRPSNYPGAEKDANYAIQLQQLGYAKRQAEAAEDAAYQARKTREAAEKRNNDTVIINGRPCIRIGNMLDC